MTYLAEAKKEQLISIAQAAEQHRDRIEQARIIPDDLALQLKESGVIRTWAAQSLGGQQGHIRELIDAVRLLAFYNGSLAWITAVTGTASLSSGFVRPEGQIPIFQDPLSMVGGLAAPAGMAIPQEGGILVTGRWSWGSGIQHCSHIVGGVILMSTDGSNPKPALAFFDPKDVKFIDNWHVGGLKGTNSIDYEVNELFVPNSHWIDFPVQDPVIDAPLYRFSFFGALSSGVAAVSLGLADRALHELKKLSTGKAPRGSRRTLSERANVQEQLARMEAQFRSASLLLEHEIDRSWAHAESGTFDIQARAALRLAAVHATETAAQVVGQAYRIGGGSSIWDGVKLLELFRDVNTVTQHGLVSQNLYEMCGKASLGLKVNPGLL
ncbi:MAG: acyl-CoA dehydrogenase family protein [Bacteroidota bacterium]